MRLRFPLPAKILLWFVLNLMFLGVVFYVFLKVQFHLGLDSLLMGRTGERLQAVSEIINAELGDAPSSEWTERLNRFSKAYKVKFFLFRLDGTQAAGESVTLPLEVRNRVEIRRALLDFVGRGPPAGRGPNRPMENRPPDNRPPENRPPDNRPLDNRPLDNPPLRGPMQAPRFMVRTENPVSYWVGVRIPAPESARPMRPGPMTLVAMSHSLWGGGVFFDLTPWVAVGAGVVFLSVLFWVPLVRGVTRSISQMTRATEQIAEGRFDTRVDARRGDELGRLGQAINQMASRLNGFVTGQKRFLGDIAHELCSPIARMQMALGILEQRADEQQLGYVNDVREEVQHMSGLVNELLSFSKASLEPASVKLQPVNLQEIVAQALHRETTESDRIESQVPADLTVLADPQLLMRSLANLIRNAVRYAGHAGPISISANRSNGFVTLTVSDCGPGVPEDSVERLFDPFYRPEMSRSAETGGVGLGLAIVKTCVESCQGTVSCRNRSPSGLEVTLRLKSAPVTAT